MRTTALIVHLVRPVERGFWQDYLTTMRPYLLYVSGITGIAGLSLVSDVATSTFLILGFVFFFAYGFGQAITDCFQMDTDRLSAPERPLVRGTIVREDVLLVSLGGLFVSTVILVAFNPLILPVAALTVLGILTYTWFKRRWWGGPWYNAWIVSLLVLMGYLAGAGAAGDTVGLGWSLFGVMFVAFSAYANFVLSGYYKDIDADRATEYQTLPVVFGRRASAWISDSIATLSMVGAGIMLLTAPSPWRVAVAAPFFAAALWFAAVAQLRLHRLTTDAEAHRAIEPVVHSYILVMSSVTAVYQPAWVPFLAGFYVAFVWTVRQRPMREQI